MNLQPINLEPIRDTKRLDQYFGIWAVEPERGQALFNRAAAMNLTAHVQANANREIKAEAEPLTMTSKTPGQRDQTIAVITLAGTLTKAGSSLDDSSSLVRARRDIQLAAADPSIDGILLYVDSPGGTAAGTQDTAAALAAANIKKPVLTYVEDLAASAAYWIGAQADRIVANNQTATVGSIGVYSVVYDFSAAFAKEGIQAHLFTTGPLKGAGTLGTQLTPDQAAQFQSRVDQIHQHFKADLAAGRKMAAATVDALATGRTWLAADALALGLIDAIGGFDFAVSQLQDLIDGRKAANPPPTNTAKPPEKPTMANEPNQVTPAALEPTNSTNATPPTFSGHTAAEWIAEFGESGARWALEGRSWTEAQQMTIAALRSQLADAQAANEQQAKIIDALKGTTPAAFSPTDGTPHKAAGDQKHRPALAQFIRINHAHAAANN